MSRIDSCHAHHLQTLVVVTRTVIGIPIPGLAPGAAERNLPAAVRPVNPHEALALGFQQVLSRVLKPAIDKVAMEAVALADLFSTTES
jgi:hypothetical protein